MLLLFANTAYIEYNPVFLHTVDTAITHWTP